MAVTVFLHATDDYNFETLKLPGSIRAAVSNPQKKAPRSIISRQVAFGNSS